MTTKRESILQSLLASLETMKETAGVKVVERNRTADIDVAPTVILRDGGEDEPSDQPGWRPGMPWKVTMRPEIVFAVDGEDAELGTLANDMLSKLQRTVLVDGYARLQPIIGSGGSMRRGRIESIEQEGSPARKLVSVLFPVTYTCNPIE